MATLLMITVLLPILGSLILVVLPKLDFVTARSIALVTALVTLGFSVILLFSFDSRSSGPHSSRSCRAAYGLEWVGRPDIRFALGLDGLSLWLFLLTSILASHLDRSVVVVDPRESALTTHSCWRRRRDFGPVREP